MNCAGKLTVEFVNVNEDLAGRAGCAGRGNPDCRENWGCDGDGRRGQDGDRTKVTQAAAVVGAVVSFLLRGEGVVLGTQGGAQQQHDERELNAQVPLE